MKLTSLASTPLLAALLATILVPVRADITIDNPSYSATSVYTDTDNNSIVSFDWDASNNLYYQTAVTSDYSYNLGGFYKVSSGVTSNLLPGSTSAFAGESVVSIGNNIYFNDSDTSGNQNIYKYSPTSGGTPTVVSTTTNFGLYKGPNGSMYITGSTGFGPNNIYYSGLDASGNLVSDPAVDLGAQPPGSSGPLAFDSTGDLYYAPGYDDLSIYKWTSAQVAAALANPAADPLTTADAQQWVDYSSTYGSVGVSGGTSLLIDGDQLLLTLTNFSGPSELAAFDINSTDGDYSGVSSTILEDDGGALGELRLNDGSLFVSDGTQIYDIQSVPEPSAFYLLAFGIAGLFFYRIRRTKKSGIAATLAILGALVSFNSAWAGPFSPAGDQPGSNGVAASDPAIQEWASTVDSYDPGPDVITVPGGAKPTYNDAQNALGPADASATNPYPIVSLGDGGSITLSFADPIANGAGADFAVYDNKFKVADGNPGDYFLELATVAVSSDGVNFFTFPSVSLTQTTTQIGGFGYLDPTNLYNLAGSEIAGYGTPFNLDDLAGVSPLLNIDDVTEVRITDVIGNINTSLGAGTYDYDDASNPIFDGLYGTTNHLINAPYPTPFASSGFSLDAVGVLNVAEVPEPSSMWYFLASLGALMAMHQFYRRRTAQV